MDASERAYTGYTVVMTGTLLGEERESILKRKISQKIAPEKKDDVDDPKINWPASLRGELRLLHGEYRVLCSTDCEWDAVEGASRTLASAAKVVQNIKTALPPLPVEIDPQTMKPIDPKAADVLSAPVPSHVGVFQKQKSTKK